ncbi:hypothetical protein [Tuberibacillus sp. Marseille-P3662]|uniref:hypothetical protein n=1 Tax=Tuberibacillus sp. Marseille-P3662 TaxID=1965358 RepID=UPI000A1C9CE8|nr:hypothetical protein [Tuberibacillus sp. Marseille-P3662]
MKNILPELAALVSVLIIVAGCSSSDATSSKGKNGENKTSVSTKDNGKSADPSSQDNKKNKETIRTYLTNEFTGPSEKLKKLFKKQKTEDPTALNPYIEEKYKPLIAEKDLQTFLNTYRGVRWLQPAYFAGYQLKPKTNIEIQKVDSGGIAYTFKFEVEYSKEGKTNTAAITGHVNINDDGKIQAIRVEDSGLAEKFLSQTETPKKGKTS